MAGAVNKSAVNVSAVNGNAAPPVVPGLVGAFPLSTQIPGPLVFTTVTCIATGGTSSTFSGAFGFISSPLILGSINVASGDSSTLFGVSNAASPQTVQAPGWLTSTYGAPSALQIASVSGWSSTALGAHSVKLSLAVSGIYSTQLGANVVSVLSYPAASAGLVTQFGSPTGSTRRSLVAAFELSTQFGVPLANERNLFTAAQNPSTRFGAPKALKPNTYYAIGPVIPAMFGQPRGAFGAVYVTGSIAAMGFGAPKATPTARPMPVAPLSTFGTPLMTRAHIC